MITESASEFFVNGHHCEIQYESREHYTGWVDGEQIASSHSTSHVREELINDAKWRVEKDYDTKYMYRAVYNFLKSQTSHDGEYIWTHRKVIAEEITPVNNIGPVFSVLLDLNDRGFVERDKIAMRQNVEDMFRAVETDKSIDELPEN